jgi:hypothetical protein
VREAIKLVFSLLKLLEPPYLGHTHASKLLLAAIERWLEDTQPPADLLNRGPGFRLPQGKGDLFVLYRFLFMAPPPSRV